MNFRSIKCLLWDFGDTLCDERFIWNSGPEWMAVYETFDEDGIGARWSRGEINTREFSQELTTRINLPATDIERHMVSCCHNISFFPRTCDFFRARLLPQAIVTVNPDLFTDVIVPVHKLDSSCDAIVTSWEEGTEDKRVLGGMAIERMSVNCRLSEALLIDNKQQNIDEWTRVGGAGYLFTDDDAFARDFDNWQE